MHRISTGASLTGGSGTFSVASWNIRDGNKEGFVHAAKGMKDMGIGCVFLSEVKIIHNMYPRAPEGYKLIMSRGDSNKQGGVALLWE